MTAVPNTGYHFVDWSDGVLTATRTDTNVTANVNVTANFAINSYTLTYTAGANGTITGTSPQTVNYGADGPEVTAVPNTGYHFVDWSDGVLTAARTDTNVTANMNVTANFAINVAPVVENTNDSGPGSLRQALLDAADGDTITFDFGPVAPDAPDVAVITLTSGELVINNSITIMGPGADVLEVTRDPNASAFRIFHVMPSHTVTIQGMTISNGNSGTANGGGILNDHSTLSVDSCALSGNVASIGYGGGIFNDGSSGGTASLMVTNSTLSGNSSPAGSGGGIYNEGLNGARY